MENTKILTEAQIKAIEKVAEVVTKAIDAIIEIVKRAVKVIHELLMRASVSRRVKCLAIKHGNPRVRKKNIHRILKKLRRQARCRE